MNLTDDQLRSLRGHLEATREARQALDAYVGATPRDDSSPRFRALVDAWNASRAKVDLEFPLVLALLEEVERLRDAVHAKDDAIRETKAERDALVAKAEAGKGLMEALERVEALFDDLMNIENLHVYEPTAAVVTAALVQWKEAGNG